MSDEPNSLAPSNGWMVVYIAHSEPEAYIVTGRLQTEGIPAFVHQEPVGKAYGFTVGPLGEVKVLVSPGDYDQALAILDDDAYESDDLDITPDDDDDE
jgi:hypothetical protein